MKCDRIFVFCLGLFLISSLSVFAGTEDDPEITDAENDADDNQNPTADNDHLDIVSAWFIDESNSSMKFTVRVLSLDSVEEETQYTFYWIYDDENYFCRLREDNGIIYEYGTWASSGGTTSYFVDGNCEGDYFTGTPGYVIIDLDKEHVGSPSYEDDLTDTEVRTHRRNPSTRVIDFADGDDFILDWIDTDGDGIHNDDDDDDDNDGYTDTEENLAGTDSLDKHDFPPEESKPDDDSDDENWIPGFELMIAIIAISIILVKKTYWC